MKSLQTAHHIELSLSREVRMRYLLFLPRGYESNRSARWPLILFLHGAGERGRTLSKVALHGPPKVAPLQPDFPFMVASPQCPAGQVWSNDALLTLLDQLLEEFPVDQRRIYLTGLSMGGYGAWSLALACPERFAAVAPVCGGGDILPVLLGDPKKLKAFRALPIWAFHGAKDTVVPLQESERMVAAFREVGNPIQLTVYPHLEHDSWTVTYAEPALYEWFLRHRRPR